MLPIPIQAAANIAKKYEYDQVIIIARAVNTGEHITTYGKNKLHCKIANRIGRYIKYKLMMWEKP